MTKARTIEMTKAKKRMEGKGMIFVMSRDYNTRLVRGEQRTPITCGISVGKMFS